MQLFKQLKIWNLSIALVVVRFGMAGRWLLIPSHSITPPASIEIESGTLSSAGTVCELEL